MAGDLVTRAAASPHDLASGDGIGDGQAEDLEPTGERAHPLLVTEPGPAAGDLVAGVTGTVIARGTTRRACSTRTAGTPASPVADSQSVWLNVGDQRPPRRSV